MRHFVRQLLAAAASIFASQIGVVETYAQTVLSNAETPPNGCTITAVETLRIGQLDQPTDEVFGFIVAFDVGDDGNIYVLDSNEIRVFSKNGGFLRRFGRTGRGPGEFSNAYRILVGKDRVWVYESQLGRIIELTQMGREIRSTLLPFSTISQPFMAEGPDRSLYLASAVADSVTRKGPIIHVFDESLKLKKSFGRLTGVPDTDWPHVASGALAIEPGGTLLFSPMFAYEIRRYSPTGTHTHTFRKQNQFQFYPRPYIQKRSLPDGTVTHGADRRRAVSISLAVDSKSNVWHFVVDIPNNRTIVDVFDPSGKLRASAQFRNDVAPHLYRNGALFGTTMERGFPQVVRFEPRFLTKNGKPC